MHVTDMIMVITNDKGTEKGSLMIYPDYLEKVIFERADDYEDVAKLVEDIVTTRGTDGDWAECYSLGNKSVYARYCKDHNDLTEFLNGGYDFFDCYEMDERACSKECLDLLESLNISLDGKRKGITYHYEKQPFECKPGEIFHNFNGCDYRVVEKYSEDNILFMDIKTGNFVVGIDVCQYVRYPQNAKEYTLPFGEQGIEWGHGLYLPNLPSCIDFAALKRNYGDLYKAGKGEYKVEIRETLATVEKIEADTPEEAIVEAERRYRDEEVVLDDMNVVDREFIPLGKSR